MTPVDRFLERIDTSDSDGCWPWTGTRQAKGYGAARIPGTRKVTTASRIAYMLASGEDIPAGMVVRHSCDNPPCCRPAHLLLGTPRENSADMVKRGRARPGGRSVPA